MNQKTILEGAVATLGGTLAYFIGPFDAAIKVLLTFVIIDYISGILSAAFNAELSSKIGFKGLAKKVFIFLIVGMATLLDRQLLHLSDALRTAVIFFYIANEGLSILENAGELGVPVLEKFVQTLKKIKENDDSSEQ